MIFENCIFEGKPPYGDSWREYLEISVDANNFKDIAIMSIETYKSEEEP